MERVIFVLVGLMIAILTNVRGEKCNVTNAVFRYEACKTDVKSFLATTNTSVSRCKSLYNNAADCYDKLRGHCGDSPTVKWLEYIINGARLRRIGTLNCENLKVLRKSHKCAGDASQLNRCIVQATQLKKDFCARWNAAQPCYTQFYGKCPAKERGLVEKNLQIEQPDGCKSRECDVTNAVFRYDACTTDVTSFLATTNTSVSRCKSLYNNAADCYDKLRGHCGDSPIAKWQEYIMTGARLRRVGTYSCENLKTLRKLEKCAGDASQFYRCTLWAMQSNKDFCARWNAAQPCYTQLYGKCPAEERELSKNTLQMERPDGCKSRGTKTNASLALLALPSILFVLYGLVS